MIYILEILVAVFILVFFLFIKSKFNKNKNNLNEEIRDKLNNNSYEKNDEKIKALAIRFVDYAFDNYEIDLDFTINSFKELSFLVSLYNSDYAVIEKIELPELVKMLSAYYGEVLIQNKKYSWASEYGLGRAVKNDGKLLNLYNDFLKGLEEQNRFKFDLYYKEIA